MEPSLKLNAAQIQDVFHKGLPAAQRGGLAVEEVRPGYARVRFPFGKWMLRPGGTISGPALFTAADSAMYACVMAHVGPEVMAVTSNLSINFLARGKAGDILAEARLLRLGKRLAVMEVGLRTGGEETLVAHVTGSYAIPVRSPE